MKKKLYHDVGNRSTFSKMMMTFEFQDDNNVVDANILKAFNFTSSSHVTIILFPFTSLFSCINNFQCLFDGWMIMTCSSLSQGRKHNNTRSFLQKKRYKIQSTKRNEKKPRIKPPIKHRRLSCVWATCQINKFGFIYSFRWMWNVETLRHQPKIVGNSHLCLFLCAGVSFLAFVSATNNNNIVQHISSPHACLQSLLPRLLSSMHEIPRDSRAKKEEKIMSN